MYFRERGTAVQLIRTTYVKDKKRPKQDIIGRMPRLKLKVPDDVAAQLTAEEKAELQSYIERVSSLDLLRRKLEAHTLLRTVMAAIEYASEIEDVGERDLLRQEFAQAIIALRRASAVAARGGDAEGEDGDK